jgi:hypothetical protein
MNIVDTRPPGEDGRKAALVHLLQRVWTYEVTTKSDDARAFADEIAEGSSRGLLTTQVVPREARPSDGYGSSPRMGSRSCSPTPPCFPDEEVRYAETYCTR